MSRSKPPLQQHLLTRSDLALMGVPAADILVWLAEGSIEQMGSMATDAGDDPVFTVAPALRAELTVRLAKIGKTAVVLSPTRVRSFLMRALLQREQPQAAIATEPLTIEPTAAVTDHLLTTDLAQVLQEAVADVEADVDAMLRLAEEEARLEAEKPEEQVLELAPAVTSAGEGEQGNGEEECFDVDDLANALGGWETDTTNAPAVAAAPVTSAVQSPRSEPEATETMPAIDTHADQEAPEASDVVPTSQEPTMTDAMQEPEAMLTTTPEHEARDAVSEATKALDELLADPATTPPEEVGVDLAAALATLDAVLGDPPPAPRTKVVPEVVPEATSAAAAEVVAAAPPPPPSAEAAGAAAVVETQATPVGDEQPVAQPTNEDVPALQGGSPAADGESASSPGEAAAIPMAAAPTNVESLRAAAPGAPSAHEPEMALAVANATMQRVEGFLEQLKGALVELAARPTTAVAAAAPPPAPTTVQVPAPAPVDVGPLVEVLKSGFDRSLEQAVATTSALTSLSERMDGLGHKVEQSAQQTTAAMAQAHSPAPATSQPARFVVTRSNPLPFVMLALAALVMAWSVLFWFKTGSPRLALGTLVGANAIGCILLMFGRQRP